MAEDLPLSRTRVIPGAALSVRTARASGPGGQHVNRTETKVQLRFDPRAVPWIDEGTRLRLISLAGRNVDSDGCLLFVSQEHRDQAQNLDAAREKLRTLALKALVRPKLRIATKPTRASKARRVNDKKQRSKTKQHRGKVSRDD